MRRSPPAALCGRAPKKGRESPRSTEFGTSSGLSRVHSNPRVHLYLRLLGCEVEEPVPPLLRFQQKSEGRIAADIDPLDRVHLHGDIEGHDNPTELAGNSKKTSG